MAGAVAPGVEAAIRRHVGSLEHVEGLEERVDRLGEPAAVALEIAMERVGEIAMTDSGSKAGDESTSRSASDGKAAEALVAKLANYLATSTDVQLNTAAEALLAEAQAEESDTVIRSLRSTVSDVRPG